MARVRWRTQPLRHEDPPRRPGPDPELAGPASCAVCGREARGFAYVRDLRRDLHPVNRFCSMGCLRCGSERAMRQTGDLATTDMEAAAIRFARRHFAETVAALDLMDPFVDVGAAEIDRINGLRRRLSRGHAAPDPAARQWTRPPVRDLDMRTHRHSRAVFTHRANAMAAGEGDGVTRRQGPRS